jgi:DNA polymerase III subunit epsilon
MRTEDGFAGVCPVAHATGFAVVDVETTGLFPARDRVVELAVVHLDPDARVTGEFSTLIDPRRDVGPTHIHGIKAADVSGAPTFAEAAPTILGLLAGRVLVAHNARFDAMFLDAELGRSGMRLSAVPVMCTMQLAGHYLGGLPARTLPACCQAAGVTLSEHHSALHDARAAAGLLRCYRGCHREIPPSWREAMLAAARAPGSAAQAAGGFHPVTRASQQERRSRQRGPLADLADRLPAGTGGDRDAYLAVLDAILEDRIITAGEAAELIQLASRLGMSQDAARQAHRDYLGHVGAAAWRDGTVTDSEHADLLEVARLLGVSATETEAILQGAAARREHILPREPSRLLQAGDRVVFTGDMDSSRTEIEALATAAGLRVTSSVSRKTALVVAADPYSQSGKAGTARSLGVRMVTEHVFLDLLSHLQQGLTNAVPVPSQ